MPSHIRWLKSAAGLMLVTGLPLLATPALAGHGGTHDWNTGNGSFHFSANWSPTGVPSGDQDTALWNTGDGGYNVSFGGNAETNAVELDDPNVTFNLNENHYQLLYRYVPRPHSTFYNPGALRVRSGAGLTLSNGELSGGQGAIAGTLTVDEDAVYRPTRGLATFGNERLSVVAGVLNVAGTVLMNANSTTLHGGGQINLQGGEFDTSSPLYAAGWLRIQDGGRLRLFEDAELVIGVDDPGVAGSGQMWIDDGSAVISNDVIVGREFGGQLIVGSLGEPFAALNVFGTAHLGQVGTADVRVQFGGSVSAQTTMIGSETDTDRSRVLDVRHEGSFWDSNGSFYIGGSDTQAGGTGTARIRDGGRLRVMDTLRVWGPGTLVVDRGEVETHSLALAGGSTFEFTAGSVSVDGGVFDSSAGSWGFGGPNEAQMPTVHLTAGAHAMVLSQLNIANAADRRFARMELRGGDTRLQLIGASSRLHIGGTSLGSTGGRGVLDVGTGTRVEVGFVSQVWEAGELIVNGHMTTHHLNVRGETTIGTGGGIQVDSLGTFLAAPSGLRIGRNTLSPSVVLVEAGGLLHNHAQTWVGQVSNAQATLHVRGAGSRFIAEDELIVGLAGQGLLQIEDGGTVTSGDATVSHSTGAQQGLARIVGPGSRWNNTGELTIGREPNANGLLRIEDGGRLDVGGTMNLAHRMITAVIPQGTLEMIGSDSQWNNTGPVYVGGRADVVGGLGTVRIEDGLATLDDLLHLHPTGTLEMLGGRLHTHTLHTAVDVPASEAATFSFGAGTIVVDGGEARFQHTTTLDYGGTDPDNIPTFQFIDGAEARIHFAWRIGQAEDTFGRTDIVGVSDEGVPSALRSTVFGGGADLVVGDRGEGELNLLDGALADFSGGLTIGGRGDGSGVATVSGVESGHRATFLAHRGENASELRIGGGAAAGPDGGSGTLSIRDGALVHATGHVYLGRRTGGEGSLIIGGEQGGFHAELTTDRSILIGGTPSASAGQGAMVLQDAGRAQAADTVLIWETGSLAMHGGRLHTRHLQTESGATLQFDAGTIIVDGGQASFGHLTSMQLDGDDPDNVATYQFLDGAEGVVQFGWRIAREPGTFGHTDVIGVSAEGVPTTLHGTGGGGGADMLVGERGDGSLNVLDGGRADFADDLIVGARDDGVGHVVVRGVDQNHRATILANRRGDQSEVMVGGTDSSGAVGGTGTLIIAHGGLVQTTGHAYIGRRPDSIGEIVVSNAAGGFDAELVTNRSLFIGGSSSAAGGTGSLTVGPGGRVTISSALHVWESSDNTLSYILAGPEAGSGYGQLNILSGVVNLFGVRGTAGTLEILLDDYQPEAGDSFELFNVARAAAGEFAQLLLPDLGDSLTWDISSLYTDGVIAVELEAFLVGDMNLDGTVDTGDVAPFVLALTDPSAYMAQFGVDEATMTALGDINQDGAFDTGDVAPFVQLLVGGNSPSVPEPGTLALLGLGALALLRWRAAWR